LELKKEFDIVVCGDSFSSATKNGNLARSSMTNLGIAWQMRQAIEIGCKFLLYHNTWSYRLNLLINDNFQVEKGLKNFIYPFKDDESSYTKYVGHNARCTSSNGIPTKFVFHNGVPTTDNDAPILSTVPHGLENNPTLILTKDQHKAIEYHFKYFFNEELSCTQIMMTIALFTQIKPPNKR